MLIEKNMLFFNGKKNHKESKRKRKLFVVDANGRSEDLFSDEITFLEVSMFYNCSKFVNFFIITSH